MTLEERYADDPRLLGFYKRRLLEPGWAGELSLDELTYIKSQLRESPPLKWHWGFKSSAKRLSELHIRTIARDGLTANRKPVLASVATGEPPAK